MRDLKKSASWKNSFYLNPIEACVREISKKIFFQLTKLIVGYSASHGVSTHDHNDTINALVNISIILLLTLAVQLLVYFHILTLFLISSLQTETINPVRSNSDQRQISLRNINTFSIREVMRIKDMITQHESRW